MRSNPIVDIFRVKDLRDRILFTVGLLIVFRLGTFLPIPGVDRNTVVAYFSQEAAGTGGIIEFLDFFSGGALKNFSIFMLGIMPYITTSIIMQLLTLFGIVALIYLPAMPLLLLLPLVGLGIQGSSTVTYGSVADFVADANQSSLVCVQIEHSDAVANIEDILRVDGIDVYFIGRSDLSQSMGYPGNPEAPPVAKAIEKTLKQIRDAGCAPGMPAASSTVAEVAASGCKYIYTHLPKLLGAGAADYLRAVRGNEHS